MGSRLGADRILLYTSLGQSAWIQLLNYWTKTLVNSCKRGNIIILGLSGDTETMIGLLIFKDEQISSRKLLRLEP